MPVLKSGKYLIDFSEAGSGDTVVLVHSSVSGNRQWKRLAQDLCAQYRVIAVNLFGYGETSAWNGERPQAIDDQAQLLTALVRDTSGPIRVVGHSFGGSVAFKAATMLGERVSHLFLFEPTQFRLLAQHGRHQAYAEVEALRDSVRIHGKNGNWEAAAERFADYWLGDGAWAALPAERRLAYQELLRPNYHEWDCLAADQATLRDFVSLPAKAMLAWSPGAPRAIREIAGLIGAHCPNWKVTRIAEGGHMAPLTHPHLVNPLIAGFLGGGGPLDAQAKNFVGALA